MLCDIQSTWSSPSGQEAVIGITSCYRRHIGRWRHAKRQSRDIPLNRSYEISYEDDVNLYRLGTSRRSFKMEASLADRFNCLWLHASKRTESVSGWLIRRNVIVYSLSLSLFLFLRMWCSVECRLPLIIFTFRIILFIRNYKRVNKRFIAHWNCSP